MHIIADLTPYMGIRRGFGRSISGAGMCVVTMCDRRRQFSVRTSHVAGGTMDATCVCHTRLPGSSANRVATAKRAERPGGYVEIDLDTAAEMGLGVEVVMDG